jgi:hypothetical protein
VTDEPQHIQSWARGAPGEEKLGAGLDRLTGRGVRLLHDRRIRGSRANIDHLAVRPAGVFVIDAKRYRGRPQLRVQGGLFRARVESLIVGGRDRTALVDGAIKQVDLVRTALASTQLAADVPVRGMLCFIDADWPLIGRSFRVNGIEVVLPKKAYEIICGADPHPGPRGGTAPPPRLGLSDRVAADGGTQARDDSAVRPAQSRSKKPDATGADLTDLSVPLHSLQIHMHASHVGSMTRRSTARACEPTAGVPLLMAGRLRGTRFD